MILMGDRGTTTRPELMKLRLHTSISSKLLCQWFADVNRNSQQHVLSFHDVVLAVVGRDESLADEPEATGSFPSWSQSDQMSNS